MEYVRGDLFLRGFCWGLWALGFAFRRPGLLASGVVGRGRLQDGAVD